MIKIVDCSGIYKIINLVNGKIYVGSAVCFKKRWGQHKSDLKNNRRENRYLQNSWNKHGEEKFKFEILEIVKNKKNLIKREQYYLDLTKCCNREFGYNICPTAESRLGRNHSEETKRKISKAISGKNHPTYGKTRKESSNYGKKHSEETKNKMRKIKLGKKMSEEAKLKMSLSHMCENNPNVRLTKQKVRIIKWLLKNSDMLHKEIAEVFGVNRVTISCIKTGKTWKHI